MVLEHTFGALITSFASKYIDNLDLSALRLSVFGGDVVLRNLELRLEVLRREQAVQRLGRANPAELAASNTLETPGLPYVEAWARGRNGSIHGGFEASHN